MPPVTPPSRRVVVTGLGAVTPLGNDLPATWGAILNGRSAIGIITRFDASAYDDAVGAEVHDFVPEAHMPPKRARTMDRSSHFAVAAALEAVRDAGLDGDTPLGPTAGVVFGCSIGGYNFQASQLAGLLDYAHKRISPYTLTGMLPDSASGEIALRTGAMGPNMAVVTASATGAASIGQASEIIRRGDADIVIAGACEAPLTPVLFAAFSAMRAMAKGGDDPSAACKPFDARRSGFVLGEGAGAMVIESLDHARQRGARIYAELAGYGNANDAFNMVAEEPTSRGLVAAISAAIRKSGIEPTSIGYVNAHGTASRMNDPVETGALKRVFGDHAYRLAVSSTKSMTGHLMGAAGAIEAVFTVLALHHNVLPPTLNYEEPDPDCDLDYVPNHARQVDSLEAVMSNSIGLGGHNASLIFTRV